MLETFVSVLFPTVLGRRWWVVQTQRSGALQKLQDFLDYTPNSLALRFAASRAVTCKNLTSIGLYSTTRRIRVYTHCKSHDLSICKELLCFHVSVEILFTEYTKLNTHRRHTFACVCLISVTTFREIRNSFKIYKTVILDYRMHSVCVQS